MPGEAERGQLTHTRLGGVTMQKALGRQTEITEELRASHNRSIRMLTDAFGRPGLPDLASVLASLEPEKPD